jgi:hypothetical protein
MLTDHPGPDEVEVSIFGPGVGESIAVHLGFNQWMIVDSCIDSTGQVPVLVYLRRIGVDLAKDIRLVVATHAHDDHFTGIARVLDASQSAYFVVPAAGSTEEYWALRELDEILPPFVRPKAVREYQSAFRTVKQRRRDQNGNRYLKYAIQGLELMTLRTQGPSPVKVTALSPSAESLTRAREKLSAQFPAQGDRKHCNGINPNELAIALWVEVADVVFLLGADVENGPRGCGWRSITSVFDPAEKASLFKVAHHGSPNAHFPKAWTSLLTASPVALIAPYNSGPTPRPAPSDVKRIRTLTPYGYVTAQPKSRLTKEAQQEAERLGPLAASVRLPSQRTGHIRARTTPGSSKWSVVTTRPAMRLADLRSR